MNDILGNPVVLEKMYVRSQRSNGVNEITIGKAIRFTKKGVTLEVRFKGSNYSDKEIQHTFHKPSNVNCLSSSLCPVPEDVQVNWEDR